ncbi:class I SAM-dependent methyltransferase [Streptomyces sp. NPDC050095]|uniref:class I SAM-dependent methyltransferase n=1 Tax=unclassified Streptomyces TaxID=2593676 RepID=UPI00344011FB
MTGPEAEVNRMEETNVFYRDPALYDAVQADSDTARTTQDLIERYHPDAVLLADFGCGTGRDLELLAKRYDCVGIDLQPGMVAYAHKVRPSLDIRTGDMRTYRLGHRVDVVTCLGNSLAYVHDSDAVRDVFTTFAVHALPGTLLVICSPVAPILRDEPTRATVETEQTRATVTIQHTWDPATRINTLHRHWAFAAGTEARDVIQRRVLGPQELERFATDAGFEVLGMFDESGGAAPIGPTAYTVARYR